MSADPLPRARVYVAAPYARAQKARAFHDDLHLLQFEPTSTWAEHAHGAEDLTDPRAIQRAIESNDRDLARAHIVLALAFPDEGGEMFAEIERARSVGTPVVWLGARQTLGAFRENVIARVTDRWAALRALRAWRLDNASRFYVPSDEFEVSR